MPKYYTIFMLPKVTCLTFHPFLTDKHALKGVPLNMGSSHSANIMETFPQETHQSYHRHQFYD